MIYAIPAALMMMTSPGGGPTDAETALRLQSLKEQLIELREENEPVLKWNPDRFGVDLAAGDERI